MDAEHAESTQDKVLRIKTTRAQVKVVRRYVDVMRDLEKEDAEAYAYLQLDRVKLGLDWVEGTEDFWSLMFWYIKEDACHDQTVHEATRKAMFDLAHRVAVYPEAPKSDK